MILLPIVSTWASIQVHRSLYQIIPDPLTEFWDKWELPALVIMSLLSQLILLSMANRRKYRRDIWIRVLVWSAYMIADSVPTFAMGVISSKVGDYYDKNGQKKNNDMDPQLIAFWAPFFLIHLGGPHSITAYALEDSELWLRHVVSLVSQTLVTCYIILLSWKSTSSWLSYLSIPMLIVGFLKYINRIWCLYSSRISHLRDLFLAGIGNRRQCVFPACLRYPGDYVRELFESMEFLVSLSTDVVLSQSRLSQDRGKFLEASYDSAFGTIKNELDAMYDILYTKTIVNIDENFGTLSITVSVLGSMIVLILYTITVYMRGRRYSQIDHIITLGLLTHVVVSDCIANPEHVCGWLTSLLACVLLLLVGLFFCIWLPIKWLIKGHNGTEETGLGHSDREEMEGTRKEKIKMRGYLLEQRNFLILSWKEEENHSTCNYFWSKAKKLKLLYGNIKYQSVTSCEVSNSLREMIFIYFRNKSRSNLPGGYKYIICSKLSLQVSPTNLEFHKTIITWHIVTGLFFYSAPDHELLLKETKNLSDYMLFLLLNLRYMLPVGAGAITMRDTSSEANKIFPQKPENYSEAQAADMFLSQLDTLAQRQNTNHEESVLVEACKIAKQLLIGDRGQMQKLLSELWVEIVGYAAAHCKVENHAQQLRRGGEFLTEVWLLQAHLGLLDQFHHTRLENYPEIP